MAKEQKNFENLFVHVKKLEDYHPKYKDRVLQWAKIYFKMVNGDPECELLHEIDRGRLIVFILLELQAQKPVPLKELYLQRKGFDLKARPISLTLQMLHNFLDVTTENHDLSTLSVIRERERIEKDKEEDKEEEHLIADELFYYYQEKLQKPLIKFSVERKALIKKRLKDGYSKVDIKKAIDNFVLNGWGVENGYWDLVYVIGQQRGKRDNLDYFLHYVHKPKDRTVDEIVHDIAQSGKKDRGEI